MQHLGEICWAQRSRGKCGRNAYCVKARRDFQTAGLNGVFGYFCRRGQKYPAPAGAEYPFGQSAARVFRACGRGGRMWASAPTHGYRWSSRRGRCPHRPARMPQGLSVDVRRGGALPRPFSQSLRQRCALPPPSQREARRTDSHASDVGHWLGMTPLRGVWADRVVRPYGHIHRRCSPSYAEGDFLARKAK